MYEKLRINMATGAIRNLKQKYKDNIGFSGDYKKYYPILKKFIKHIDIKSVSASNKLSISEAADIDGNGLGDDTGGMEEGIIDYILIIKKKL